MTNEMQRAMRDAIDAHDARDDARMTNVATRDECDTRTTHVVRYTLRDMIAQCATRHAREHAGITRHIVRAS